jgi:hypothetical protein
VPGSEKEIRLLKKTGKLISRRISQEGVWVGEEDEAVRVVEWDGEIVSGAVSDNQGGFKTSLFINNHNNFNPIS